MIQTSIANPLTAPAVRTVPEVIERLAAIQDYTVTHEPTGIHDGLACFNYLYHVITTRVQKHLDEDFFADPAYLICLDVTFANRYLDAIRAHENLPRLAPKSWKALLESRSEEHIAPMQFAVAGVNAHVNFDLPCAVVKTCQTLGYELGTGHQRADYDKINDIFKEEMTELRRHFESQLLRWVDERLLSKVEDHLGNWSVEAARDTAWSHAEHLWSLHQNQIKESAFISGLDKMAGLAGRGVLAHL